MDGDELRVLRESSGGVVAADDQGRIAFANVAAAEALGRPLPVGSPLADLMPQRLRTRHEEGFRRYVETGHSNLEGKTVRVPALSKHGEEVEIDLTIRIFQRPDGSRLAVAAVAPAAQGKPPADLLRIESALSARAYQLI